MYTRSYLAEDKAPEIPENYDGNAFVRNADSSATKSPFEEYHGAKNEERESDAAEKSVKIAPILERLPIKKLLGTFGLGRGDEKYGDRLIRLGKEEILLIALALYMFFSKDGDKECAIMLAILVFIH